MDFTSKVKKIALKAYHGGVETFSLSTDFGESFVKDCGTLRLATAQCRASNVCPHISRNDRAVATWLNGSSGGLCWGMGGCLLLGGGCSPLQTLTVGSRQFHSPSPQCFEVK